MHKSAAAYEQGRVTRTVMGGTRNELIDPLAFKASLEAERDRLTDEKRKLEADIAEVNARISRAKAVRAGSGAYTNPKTFHRWGLEKVEKTRAINAIEARLREIKREQRPSGPVADFNEEFVKMARVLLAEAVFERVRIAALHAMSERREGA